MHQAFYPTFTVKDIETIFEEEFSTATTAQLLWKKNESFEKIFNAIKEAKLFICLQFYIFRNDDTGIKLSELLKQKQREGISIYILYDHFGSFGTPMGFWRAMKKAGIRVRASHPFKWTAPFHYVHRDHRKLVVIDCEKAFTGGLNIANEYSGFHFKTRGKVWRDTGILLEGAIVGKLFKSFKKSWDTWGGEKIKFQEVNFKEQDYGIPAIPFFIDSSKKRRRMRRLIYYSINHAKKCISLTTAYFTPSRRMVETLEAATRRGIKVRLLVPGESDVPAAWYAGRAFFSKLLSAGVEIYTYLGDILHAKTFIFDECWGIIGSTNLDFQSLRYNDEGNVGILDTGFASQMTKIFEEDLKQSLKIERDQWLKRPFPEKIKELFFSLFRRRL